MGSKCLATFSKAVFNSCSLVVVGGAPTTLHSPHFKDMKNRSSSLSVCAHGSGSFVQLMDGAIEGCIQGVTMQGASDCTVTGMQFAAHWR